MKQSEFNHYFKTEVLPSIAKQYEEDGIPDRPARREAYNNEIDNSHRSGQITDSQVRLWCMPDELETIILKK